MLGVVVELPTRRRIFVPMLRVSNIEPESVALATGSVSLRRFEQRRTEVLLVAQLLNVKVRIATTAAPATVVDAGMETHPHPGLGGHQAGRS